MHGQQLLRIMREMRFHAVPTWNDRQDISM